MFALFDEAGKLHAGRILSSAEATHQIELESGRRQKVKAAHVLLTFAQPAPTALLQQATALAADIDLDLAWEFAPDEEFGFAELAALYFDDPPSLVQQAATLLKLHEAPHYFRRAGKGGRFRKAPADQLRQALAAIERKKAVQAQIDAWTAELADGRCPEPVRAQLYRILFKPDKNAPEYKAVVHAARQTHLAPLALLQRAGAITNAYQFHWQRFLFEHFPRGTGFAELPAPPVPQELPLAEGVQAFSIDDSSTTEIDDALSVQGLGSGTVTLGVHIAAPGLAITPDSALDEVARQRLSTVYMPGHKITMLPDAVVQTYTLAEGAPRPAVSLYLTVDENTLEVRASTTRLERVLIAHNLRHDRLDTVVTADWLNEPTRAAEAPAEVAALWPQLAFLWRLAQACKARREAVRGRPETFTRPDYTFQLEGMTGPEPTGEETVVIGTRARGAPLDLIVAEAMILANTHWGQWLAELGVPGIYRSQASLAPGIKVRMGTKPLPHAGIGVPCYAWSTSPLRRYTDLVNQWQIIACARHGTAAALAAPFKPKDAALLAIISAFDAAYTAYGQFQSTMERYWTLRYLRQQGITELQAAYLKDNLVRAETLPLVLTALGTDGLQRGERVRVRLGTIDEVSLEVTGTVVERLGATEPVEGDTLEGEPEEALATPLAVAVQLDEGDDQPPASAAAADPA
ncbi:MAG: RNB domain-containing ribonuclease [Tepidimonas sp.]|uniref:ribonuclease catalytic domain-containing protein n=1 Tax=Tepidimonas sp. TaxID=2002775 RepID=UPI00298EFCD7|nr:ribonuclease catalytic domain-containing protein [Tepidimonas sp.]MCS6810309.1 RNB domain-containing ribonuclease [Tepidimonas sp.]MDW8336054.1 RNB domain-containing ribonuclease [Tepidimonas sp.]